MIKYIEKKRKIDGGASMILKESDLRRLVRQMMFESGTDVYRVRAEEVEVVYPDNIDEDLLLKGDQDKEISGFAIKRDKEDREIEQVRAGIYYNKKLVGFMTPREEKGGWRVGAIYVDEDVRKNFKGIGSIAISKFFEGREAADLLIGVDNIASQRAFGKAGFVNTGKAYKDDSDGWEATWRSNKK